MSSVCVRFLGTYEKADGIYTIEPIDVIFADSTVYEQYQQKSFSGLIGKVNRHLQRTGSSECIAMDPILSDQVIPESDANDPVRVDT